PATTGRLSPFPEPRRFPLWAVLLARAASGHAAAAPPSAASNSRRPMVTVIRPSRARCVNGTIPRHDGAVFTFRGPDDGCFHPKADIRTRNEIYGMSGSVIPA